MLLGDDHELANTPVALCAGLCSQCRACVGSLNLLVSPGGQILVLSCRVTAKDVEAETW